MIIKDFKCEYKDKQFHVVADIDFTDDVELSGRVPADVVLDKFYEIIGIASGWADEHATPISKFYIESFNLSYEGKKGSLSAVIDLVHAKGDKASHVAVRSEDFNCVRKVHTALMDVFDKVPNMEPGVLGHAVLEGALEEYRNRKK